jgi:hypothetical protein
MLPILQPIHLVQTDLTDNLRHTFETQLVDEAASATGDRLPYEMLLEERERLLRQPYIKSANGAANPIVFFNQHRQMVHANQAALSEIIRLDLMDAIGLRLGEIFGCDHKMSDLPGEVYKCQDCNSMVSLRAALQGRQSTEMRHLVMHPMDRPIRAIFRVSAVPVSADAEHFAMIILEKVEEAASV